MSCLWWIPGVGHTGKHNLIALVILSSEELSQAFNRWRGLPSPKIIQIDTLEWAIWQAETSGENSPASMFMRTSAEIRLAEDHELCDRMMLKDDRIRIMFTERPGFHLKTEELLAKVMKTINLIALSLIQDGSTLSLLGLINVICFYNLKHQEWSWNNIIFVCSAFQHSLEKIRA